MQKLDNFKGFTYFFLPLYLQEGVTGFGHEAAPSSGRRFGAVINTDFLKKSCMHVHLCYQATDRYLNLCVLMISRRGNEELLKCNAQCLS